MTNVTRLPGPIADIWDWQRLGLCRGRDSAQFFHPDGERGASRGRREAAAKSVCRSCPVRAECAAHALSTREPYGVWGGFTETERIQLLAIGWEECASRGRTRVDVPRLERRLGVVPSVPIPSANHSPATDPAETAITPVGAIRTGGAIGTGRTSSVGKDQRAPRPRRAVESQRLIRTKLRLRTDLANSGRLVEATVPAQTGVKVAGGQLH